MECAKSLKEPGTEMRVIKNSHRAGWSGGLAGRLLAEQA